MKNIIGIVLAMCMIFGLAGCGKNLDVNLYQKIEDTNQNAVEIQEMNGDEIAKSDTIGLKYNSDNNSVIVYELATENELGTTAVDEAYYGKEIKNNLTRNALQQLIAIAYTDFNNVSKIATDTDGDCEKTIRRLQDGLRFDFNFKKAKIQLALEMTVEQDQLIAYIPADSLKENGNFGVTRIDVLPMFGAVNTEEEGYFLFPDGCGALYQFGEHMGVQKTISMDVYDTMNTEIQDEDSAQKNHSNVCVPVFGISLLEKGMFANIVKGVADCSINLASAEGAYAVNRIYPSIRVRKQYPIKTASEEEVYAYQKTEYMSDFEIHYHFLQEDTSYSAMANIYREYLTANKLLSKNNSDTYLALDFLMGTNKEDMLGGQDVLLTTFEDVIHILDEINDEQNYHTKTVLYGWKSGGYGTYPSGKGFLKAVGDKRDLTELCKKYEVYLLHNYIDATAGNSGFSKQSDVVYSLGGSPLSDTRNTYYLLNPTTQFERFQKDMETVIETSSGIAFEKIGKVLYEDFGSQNRLTRYGYTQAMRSYLEAAKKETNVCTDGFMEYFLEYTDYVINLPDDTSNSFLWAHEIPFLQMVLHGSVDYGAALPGNLSSDFTKTKLKWVEYGYMPTFMLTGARESLLGTDYDLLFSSDYEQWIGCIQEIVKEFDEKLSCIKNEYVASHEKKDGVATVTYANGVSVIVNYNDEPIKKNGDVVPGNDYLVIKN